MTMRIQQNPNQAQPPLMRTDVERLLQEVGSPEQLDLSGQNLRSISLINGNLMGASLSQAIICEANLCGTNLSKADLHGADLHGTYLCWANLHGANLREADLHEADLSWADMREADLSGVSLDTADVRGADLSGVCFGEASASEQIKDHLRRKGAIFREKPKVKRIKRCSNGAGSFTAGVLIGFLVMGVASFLGVVGMRMTLPYLNAINDKR